MVGELGLDFFLIGSPVDWSTTAFGVKFVEIGVILFSVDNTFNGFVDDDVAVVALFKE